MYYRDLADNEYNGPFLTDIEELPELQYLDISKQRTSTNIGLSGFLPSFSNRTTKLRQVYLAVSETLAHPHSSYVEPSLTAFFCWTLKRKMTFSALSLPHSFQSLQAKR